MKQQKSGTSLFEQTTDNVYKMMSAMGTFDIHKLQKSDPEAYDRIMGLKK